MYDGRRCATLSLYQLYVASSDFLLKRWMEGRL